MSIISSDGRIRTFRDALTEAADTQAEPAIFLNGAIYALRIASGVPRIRREREQIESYCLTAMEIGEERGYWKIERPAARLSVARPKEDT